MQETPPGLLFSEGEAGPFFPYFSPSGSPEFPESGLHYSRRAMVDPTLFTPALQMQDENALKGVKEQLRASGYQSEIVPVKEFPRGELPEWSRPDRGGWFLMLEKSRFDEEMQVLTRIFGYSSE